MGCSATGAFRRLCLIAPLLLVCGCQQGVDIKVTQGADGVTFTLDPRSSGFRACIDGGSVYPAAPDDAPPVWDFTYDRTRPDCVTRIRYGALPAGFGGAKPPPLEAGKSYRVMLTGSGFSAATTFERAAP